MHRFFRILAVAALLLPASGHTDTKGNHMRATGTFEVKIKPAEATQFEKDMGVSRYEIDKVWSGDFEGTSKAEMVSSFTESTNAMAYVAMEQVTGKLGGKSGSFYLMHRATMTKGDAASAKLSIVVVKGSATGELAGLGGELTIIIDGAGKHSFEFDYELP